MGHGVQDVLHAPPHRLPLLLQERVLVDLKRPPLLESPQVVEQLRDHKLRRLLVLLDQEHREMKARDGPHVPQKVLVQHLWFSKSIAVVDGEQPPQLAMGVHGERRGRVKELTKEHQLGRPVAHWQRHVPCRKLPGKMALYLGRRDERVHCGETFTNRLKKFSKATEHGWLNV